MKSILVSTLLLFFCTSHLLSQDQDLVKNNGITSPLHEANIGRITFTSNEIPLENYKETDFLISYEITHKSPLYITVFMGNSLTNFLHRLAPELPAEELVKIGNYQFSFYVDNLLVYEEYLHPGAPYPQVKDTETILRKPLISRPTSGWWSEYLWGRFMNNGGANALTEGEHILKLEMRPYLKNPELVVGNLIATGQINLHIKLNPKINVANIQLNKPKSYDDFSVSQERFDVNKIKELKGKIEEEVYKDITSLVVIKNSNLLIEEYFNDADRNTLHDARSVGKSFASTAAGIAIKDGYLKSENQKLNEFYRLKDFANYSPKKEQATIKDLLTMSSVFEGDDDKSSSAGNEEKMYPTKDWVKFALEVPVDTIRSTSEWHYFTAGVVVLGDIIHKKVPGGLEKYADEKLFKPLDIIQYKWEYTPQKIANTAGGIRMNALDFAKYGQLYKNDGVWKGEQIIPKVWVNKTFTKHKAIPGRPGEFYGYLFWNKTYIVNDKQYEAFYCSGNGGNKIFIFKDEPLVVVITATAYGAPYSHSQVDKMMGEYILPAVLQHK